MNGLFDNGLVIGCLVALAAGFGAILRYAAAYRLNEDFPVGTLVVNLAASFLLGLIGAAEDPIPVVVGIGALGAMSTWSTAAAETAGMAREGDGLLAAGYVALTVTSGILAAWFGLRLGPVLF